MNLRLLGTQWAEIADSLDCRDNKVLFDLYCGGGGASYGYSQAGWTVVGVDKRSQPRYPFPFLKADAREVIQEGWFGKVKAVHASPPCKVHTQLKHLRIAQGLEASDPDYLEETRELLDEWGGLYILENVPNAPMRLDAVLCGTQFGLAWGGRQLRRHRIFEANFKITRTGCQHKGTPWGIYGRLDHEIPTGGATPPTLDAARALMGISWLNWNELKEAIPPVYTRHLGEQMMRQLIELEECENELRATGS